jgi:hypothetical protein
MQLYKRKGYWWVATRYWDAESGKRQRVQRSTGIRDDGTAGAKRTANIVAEDIARSVAIGQDRRVRQATVKEAFAANLKAKRTGQRSDATIEITLEKATKVLEFFSPDLPVKEIRDKHGSGPACRSCYECYTNAAFSAEKPRKPSTVHRELRELNNGIRALGLTPPKMPDLGSRHNPGERWLDSEQTRRLLAHVSPKRRDHILVYRLLGLRKSEIFRIEARDVDLVRRNVRVRGTKTKGADRTLPISGDVAAILEQRVELFPTGPLFETWGDGNADRELRRWSTQAGLGPVSFNDLRRSFATELALNGEPSLHVAHLLGHTSSRMVEQIYARIEAGKHLHAAVGRLSNYGIASPESDEFDEEAVTIRAPKPTVISAPERVSAVSPETTVFVDAADGDGDMSHLLLT